jgi:hypothetical protein
VPDLINLNRARKSKAKVAKATAAQENRVRFGQTKGQKAALALDKGRQTRAVDDAKREN